MQSIDEFKKQKYLNLETFRRSGESIRTPVWFVQENNILYVQTMANSGKVKRIRNNEHVNITPCKMDGRPTGSWLPAKAREVKDDTVVYKVDQLLNKKYGLMRNLFSFQANRQDREDTILEIKLLE